jgi:hypothetical protein
LVLIVLQLLVELGDILLGDEVLYDEIQELELADEVSVLLHKNVLLPESVVWLKKVPWISDFC